MAAILARIVRRTAKLQAGFDLEPETDALASLQAAEVDRRPRFPEPFQQARRGAFLEGFSLHAGVRIHANDRQGREHLCRYILRPPLALHRLSRADDGKLLYCMKRPRNGWLFLLLTPDELLAKLPTLVPPPRVHTRAEGPEIASGLVARGYARAGAPAGFAAELLTAEGDLLTLPSRHGTDGFFAVRLVAPSNR